VAASSPAAFRAYRDLIAARVAGETGDHIEQASTPNSLQCDAGKAPVTRRCGNSELVVAHRLACNRHLADAVQRWACSSLRRRRSGWAREFYNNQRARGKGHQAALSALGNRWLELLWYCLRKGIRYDEAVHVANRNRALGDIAGRHRGSRLMPGVVTTRPGRHRR
jgi:hypothetical protein